MKLPLLLFGLLLISCGTAKSKPVSVVQSIDFGSGGGFTGEIITYTLNPDGRLLKGDQLLKQAAISETTDLFFKAEALVSMQLKDPSNMYYFITVKTGNDSNTLTWHTGSANLAPQIPQLYKQLNLLINS